jgi:4-amino-4-deoxy-L-arabinose transferase-like glycosyltransferase
MLEKCSVLSLGANEYALRLFPLLSSIVSLILFYKLSKMSISERGAFIALGLCAIADPLIYYASEAKQYSSDVMFAVACVLLCLTIQKRDPPSVASLTAYGLIGGAALWFSHPAIFVLGATGTYLAWSYRKKRQQLRWLVGIFAIWLSSFALVYYINLRHLTSNSFLLAYWHHVFMPLPPKSLADLLWLPKHFLLLFKDPVGLPEYGVGLLAFIVGAVTLYQKKNELLPITGLMFGLVLLASAWNKYPFGGRLVLFLVPGLLLIIGEGVSEMLRRGNGRTIVPGVVVVVLLFFLPVGDAAGKLVSPRKRMEIRPLLSYYRAMRQEGDLLYVYHGAGVATEFYAREYGIREFVHGVRRYRDPSEYVDDVNALRGRRRVWVLFSNVTQLDGINEERFFLYVLDHIGNRLDTRTEFEASLYLYDLGRD